MTLARPIVILRSFLSRDWRPEPYNGGFILVSAKTQTAIGNETGRPRVYHNEGKAWLEANRRNKGLGRELLTEVKNTVKHAFKGR
jgi:hypothetical protein